MMLRYMRSGYANIISRPYTDKICIVSNTGSGEKRHCSHFAVFIAYELVLHLHIKLTEALSLNSLNTFGLRICFGLFEFHVMW